MVKAIVITIICMFVCLFAFQQIDPALNKNNDNIVSKIDEEDKITVTIEGEVVMPGAYKMGNTEILQDLITRAGGLLESADQDAINLSVIIDEHDYFYIPSKTVYSNNCEITSEVEKVNINTATVEQLSTLAYISTALGTKIVDYRVENGPFMAIEDIMNVSGIGRATYEKIRDYITLK